MSSHLDYEINKELGECYLFMGDMDKAEEYYNKAAGSNGVHPDPYIGLATIAVQRGDLDKALGLYSKAAGIQSSDKAVAGMGLVEMELGFHNEAFDHFAEALKINPENIVAAFGMVQLGYALQRLDAVVPHLANILALAPDKNDVRFALAGCLVSLGNVEEATRHLDEILVREPDNAAAIELYQRIMA
jgi:tetratricopeptide (TPR) repeat protein